MALQEKKTRKHLHNQLVIDCLEWLAIYGYFAWQNNTGAFVIKEEKKRDRFFSAGQPGSSDILTLSQGGGVLWGIECKIPPDTQRRSQKIFQMMVEKHGGFYSIVTSVAELAAAEYLIKAKKAPVLAKNDDR